MNSFAVRADLRSTHFIRHDSLHAVTWRKATRGRTIRRLTKKRCSFYAALLHLTYYRSEAVMLIMHTSRARSRHGRCCLVNLRKGIPDDNASLTDFLLARAPIYGTKGARKELLKASALCDVRLWSRGESDLQGLFFIRA